MLRASAAAAAALLFAIQPVGVTPCPGVRPGARIIIVDRTWCTANFVFEGADGARYIGTAGHCLVDSGVSTFPDGGHRIETPDGKQIGHAVYARHTRPGDFGLIRIDNGVKTKAKMCHFGGPTKTFTGETSDPVFLHHYGHGYVLGYLEPADQRVVPARTAMALSIRDSNVVGAVGLASGGDSGSPVIDDAGRAIGVLVALGGESMSPIGIRRLGPEVELAEQALGTRLRLLTARYPGT